MKTILKIVLRKIFTPGCLSITSLIQYKMETNPVLAEADQGYLNFNINLYFASLLVLNVENCQFNIIEAT